MWLKKAGIGLLLIIPLLCTGCWDRKEIEERTAALAIAVDKDPEDPEQYKVSIQIAIPFKVSGSTGGAEGKDGDQTVQVISSTGRSLSECFQRMQRRLNEQLFFGHTRVIAIGEEVASEGIQEILDPLRRHPEIRRLLWPVVVRGKAITLLEASPSLTQIPMVFTMRLIQSGISMQTIPNMILGDFYVDLSSNSREPFMNFFEINGNEVEWSGIALFKGDRMIGQLGPKSTWDLMRVRENKNGESMLLELDDGEFVYITLEQIRERNRVSLEDGKVVVRTSMEMEGKLNEKITEKNLFTVEQFSILEQKVEEVLNERSKEMLERLQHHYKVDTIGYGGLIKAFYPKIWKQIDWKEEYPRADIEITYEYHLRNIGMVNQ